MSHKRKMGSCTFGGFTENSMDTLRTRGPYFFQKTRKEGGRSPSSDNPLFAHQVYTIRWGYKSRGIGQPKEVDIRMFLQIVKDK